MTPSHARSPVVAGQFYDGARARLERAVTECLGDYRPPKDLGPLVGGVAPHAGWMFSGPTAAKVFQTLAAPPAPVSYILLGAVHRYGVRGPAVFPSGTWLTPLGPVAVDEALGEALVSASRGLIQPSTAAHEGEHSIEVQVPFIQALSPDARIVPVAVPPTPEALAVGKAVAEVIRARDERVVFVASTDLTHYGMGYGVPDHGRLPGALGWMHQNDRRVITLAETLQAERILTETQTHQNACGPGALAAAVAAARELGALRGRLLEYTTSAEVLNELDTDRAVGYAGLVFERGRTDA